MMDAAPPADRRPPPSPDRTATAGADRLWTLAALLIGAACAATFVVKAAGLPGGAIPDDARQFLSWMGRFADPALLRGDLVADYWRSVTPWAYRWLFHAVWGLGVEPSRFALVLPAILFPLATLFVFRFERAIGVPPFVAFLMAIGFAVYAAHTGTITSATPRAFWPVALPALLDGLARRNVPQSALAQLCLAGTYPQLTLVTATLIGLTLIDFDRRRRLDLSARRLALVGACALATVAGIAPFLLDSGSFAPIVRLDEALRLPMFGPGGRNRIVEADGSLDFLCGFRLGLFPKLCRGSADPLFWLFALLALAGPLVLLARRLRKGAASGAASELPFLLLVASLAWFAVAASVLFRLHLPSRYATVLVPLMIMATLPVLIGRIASSRFAPRLRAGGKGWRVAGLALALFGAATVPARPPAPQDPRFIEFLRALPKEAVVAGFVGDLDFSPVLTDRRTLFSRELAIGYQLGYIRPILARMQDMRDAVLGTDPAVVADRLRRNGVDVLVVEMETLGAARIPLRSRTFFDAAELERAEAAAHGRTALAWLAASCTIGRFRTVVALDARCLEREAASRPE